MEKLLDLRGLACPLPVIEARKALKSLTAEVLEIIVDTEPAVENLQKMARQMDLKCDLVSAEAGETRLNIYLDQEASEPITSVNSGKIQAGKVVMIASEFMGAGDPVLGKILLKGFIYTLTELEQYPEKVLLYNSGVKLAVGTSDSVLDLRKLEAEGVEILSCGTCLDFYELTKELQVGQVTNMYDIVQSALGANLIVQP